MWICKKCKRTNGDAFVECNCGAKKAETKPETKPELKADK